MAWWYAVTTDRRVDERLVTMENLHAFARAGADLIITYHVREVVEKKGWI